MLFLTCLDDSSKLVPFENHVHPDKIQKGYFKDGLKQGQYEEWLVSPDHNRLVLQCRYVNGILHGNYKRWDSNGEEIESGQYFNGKKEGYWKETREKDKNFNDYGIGRYMNGNPHGLWQIYHKNGEVNSCGNLRQLDKQNSWEKEEILFWRSMCKNHKL